MDIVFRPVTEPVERAIPPIERHEVTPQPGVVDVDRSTPVISTINRLEAQMANSSTRDEARRRLINLPVQYFVALQPDKAAQAAAYIIAKKLATPQELFDAVVSATAQKHRIIQKLETQRGQGQPGRMTIGGLLDPGLRTGVLAESTALAAHTIAEALEFATRRNSNGHLRAMFPQFEPIDSRPRVETVPVHTVQLGHVGCCGLEIATPDSTNT